MIEALRKIAGTIQDLDARQLQKYIIISLAGAALCSCFALYYIHQKNEELITQIKQMRTLSGKLMNIFENNRNMIKEELRIKELLDKNRDFTMKGFFEQFCREQNLIPEQGWDTRTEQVSEKFDEVTLPATFKQQTTESIVKVLDALEKKDIVYIKELDVRNDGPGKIAVTITLATKKYKTLFD